MVAVPVARLVQLGSIAHPFAKGHVEDDHSVDESVTSPNAFVGVTLRPKLSDQWRFISRADIGGGDANLTWTAEAGLDFRFKPWGSLAFGYKGLGIDVEYDDKVVRKYDVVHHGPFVALGMHWGNR